MKQFNALMLAHGGDGGIRTLDRALQPYNGLANRRLQPLGHVSAHPENGALWMRSHMLAEVCPSTGAMAIPPHAAEPPVGTATALCPAWRPSVAPGCSLCALQQSHTPAQNRPTGETSLYSTGADANLRLFPGGRLAPNQTRTPLAAARA
jgi:hypothetical protein